MDRVAGTDPALDAPAPTGEEGARDPYEMANLYPRSTGLPMTVWVSPRGGARHDARVKVSRGRGDRVILEEAASVAVRPAPRLVAGELPDRDLRLVARWIEANREAILDYWDGAMDTLDLATRLVKVAPEPGDDEAG